MDKLAWMLLYMSIAYGTVTGDICDDFLLPTVPDSHITASSTQVQTNSSSGPERARLNVSEVTLPNGKVLVGGWRPASDGSGQYIQVMFDEVTFIGDVVTQGQNGGSGHMTLYKVEYTEDGKTWQPALTDIGVEQIFQWNADSDSPIENPLLCPVFAKGIRIRPLDWKNHIALRFDVKGCYVDTNDVVAAPTASITPITTIVSTKPAFLPGIPSPFGLTATTSNASSTMQRTTTTASPRTTINLLTLFHMFLTAIGNNGSTAVTSLHSPKITLPATTTRKKTTTVPPFQPGVPNPFGNQTVPPFKPGSGLVG